MRKDWRNPRKCTLVRKIGTGENGAEDGECVVVVGGVCDQHETGSQDDDYHELDQKVDLSDPVQANASASIPMLVTMVGWVQRQTFGGEEVDDGTQQHDGQGGHDQ